MEIICVRRLANFSCALALLLCLCTACQKKTEKTVVAATPTPARALVQANVAKTFAPPIEGAVTPAIVSQGADSITRYLHYPKSAESAGKTGAVQFYCDVTSVGTVETIHALVGKDPAFNDAVQTALDWGRFTPATVDGKPVRSYLGGTVLFLQQNNQALIVVSLATQDRDRVSKFANYIQPQIVGGLRHGLEGVIATLKQGVLVGGQAEVVVHVDATGKVTGTSDVSENPKGSGLGSLVESAMRKAQFTPAYEDGKPAAGAINVVANFSLF